MMTGRFGALILGTFCFGVSLLALSGQSPAQQNKNKKEAPAPSEQTLLADIKAPSDFTATIFGSPPLVNYPTCLSASPTGELFVGVDEDGSLSKDPGRGRVMRCVDTDGDGKADKIDVFCTVDHPRGLIYDNKVVYVLHPPFLSAFYDDDGDGKSDRSEVLAKNITSIGGLTSRGADHTTNNIRLGIDGWIYMAVGDFGMPNAEGKDGTKLKMQGGGIVRIRPDGTGMERVSWGQRNIYDVAIDPFMNLYTRDNDNDGHGWDTRISHVIPTGHYGYPLLFTNFADEINPSMFVFGRGSPTGALYVDEPLLPAPFNRGLFTCEWNKGLINRHPLEAKGATFTEKNADFLKISRPTDIEVDGVGHVYVASWRGGVFNYAGPNIGYVALLTPKNLKATPFPDLKAAKDDELVGYLVSDSQVKRQYAQREILRRGDKGTLAKNIEAEALKTGPLAGRVAAIFTLKQLLGAKSIEPLVAMTKSAEVREFALKALADDTRVNDKVPAEPFVQGLKDSDPRVRLQAVIGVGRLGKSELGEKLVPLLADADPAVATIAMRNLALMHATEACFKAIDPASSPAIIHGAALALQQIHEPAIVDGLIKKLNDHKEPAVRQNVLRALARLYFDEAPYVEGAWWGTTPDTKGPYFKRVTWSQTKKVGDALHQVLIDSDAQTLGLLLKEVNKNSIPFAETSELMVKLATKDPAYRAQAVDVLSGGKKVSAEGIELLRGVVIDGNGSPALRTKALKALHALASSGNIEAPVSALAKLDPASLPNELSLARDAFVRDGGLTKHIEFFGKQVQSDDAGRRALAYAVLLQISDNSQLGKDARDQARKLVDRAWAEPVATASLLRAIGDSRADEYALQVKQYRDDKRAEVKEAATYAAKMIDLDAPAAVKTGPLVGKLPYDEVLAAEMAKTSGDVKVGSRLLVKQGCILCHTVSPLDTPKGPPLSDIASHAKRDEIIESILKPNAKISQGFETQYFILNNGKQIEGFVVREAGDEVEIRNVGGITTILQKTDIDERGRRDTSVMPEGLVNNLTLDEFGSLLAYLETLRSKGP